VSADWDSRPPPERVSALGRNAITAMLDALPAKDLAFCLRQFSPRQKGFRKGHSPPSLTKSQLASALTTHVPKESSSEWHAYIHAWSDFTQARFGDPWLDAHRILDGNGKADPALIESIQAAVTAKRFSREELLQALRLAPLTVDADAVELAGTAPTQSDVDARRRDDDIDAMKNDLTAFNAALSKVVARINVVEKVDPLSTRKLDERLTNASDAIAKDLAKLKRDVTAFEERFTAVATAMAAIPGRTTTLDAAISDLGDKIKANTAELTALQRTLPRIAALEQTNEAAGIDEMPKVRAAISEIEAIGLGLLERVETLEARDVHVASASSPIQHENRRLRLDWLQRAPDTQQITTVQELATAIDDALDLVGVREASAALVANELAAAVACGQWSILRGSCATEVGEVIAAALDPNIVHIVASAASLAPISLPRSNSPRVVLLEGVNRIALEAVARDLRVSAIRQQLGLAPSSDCVFAVCTEGATSLPIGMELLELGPIVDVDALDWRSSVTNRPLRISTLTMGITDTSPLSLHEFDDHEFKAIKGRETRVWRLGTARWLGVMQRLGASAAEMRAALVCDWVLPLCVLVAPEELASATYAEGSREARVSGRLQMLGKM